MAVFYTDYHTESTGTIITEIIPPLSGFIPRITGLAYECAATAHTVTVMRCVATTTAAAAAAAAATQIEVTATDAMKTAAGVDETLAANDFVVLTTDDGSYEVLKVNGLTGNTVTFTSALANNVDVGATLYYFGEVGRSVHQVLKPAASTRTIYNPVHIQGGLPGSLGVANPRSGAGDPMVVHVDNITNAGFLHYVSGTYVAATDVAMN